MTLQIEAGKYYRTRDGRKVGPMQQSDHPSWPWIVVVGNGKCWNDDGSEVPYTDSGDIIAEWQDYHPPHIVNHNGREYDLTALETPFGLLPEPVRKALKAWPHGVLRFYWNGEWRENYKIWSAEFTYRAKPAPVETRICCYRGEADHRGFVTRDYGTCIKRPDGTIDWATWEPEA